MLSRRCCDTNSTPGLCCPCLLYVPPTPPSAALLHAVLMCPARLLLPSLYTIRNQCAAQLARHPMCLGSSLLPRRLRTRTPRSGSCCCQWQGVGGGGMGRRGETRTAAAQRSAVGVTKKAAASRGRRGWGGRMSTDEAPPRAPAGGCRRWLGRGGWPGRVHVRAAAGARRKSKEAAQARCLPRMSMHESRWASRQAGWEEEAGWVRGGRRPGARRAARAELSQG